MSELSSRTPTAIDLSITVNSGKASLPMTTQSVSRAPLRDEGGGVDDLVGFQVAVRRDHHVIVLDLLHHPCARHIVDDIARAGASGSIAELVAGIAGARLVAGIAGEQALPMRCDPNPATTASTATLDAGAIPVARRREVLTAREREVLELVTQGHPDPEIADRLSLSVASVHTHLRFVYRKIDVSTRADAIQWGVDHGAGC